MAARKKKSGMRSGDTERNHELVRKSLLAQLAAMGADRECFISLVNDYMHLWDIKEDLIKDIEVRSVMYEDVSAVGVTMMKNNPSTKELVMVSKQMLQILKDLRLTTDMAATGGGDGDGAEEL